MEKSHKDMIEKNQIGGNLAAHEEGNKNAAEKSDRETAAALSAAREQYKRVRVKQSKADGNWHIGDTRTQKEIDDTMNANKKGREKAGGSDWILKRLLTLNIFTFASNSMYPISVIKCLLALWLNLNIVCSE